MKLKHILISQPKPADIDKSPYAHLVTKYNLSLEFRKFIKIEGVHADDFRLHKVYLKDYNAIIFTSRTAIDHFFAVLKEIRYEMPDSTKYYCNSEATAYYLQKYVQFRKRKVFHGNKSLEELFDMMDKTREEDKIMVPGADVPCNETTELLDRYKFEYRKVVVYRTLTDDIKDIDLSKYNIILLFSPFGVTSLFDNFPDYSQGDTIFGGFGESTVKAMEEAGLKVDITAPTESAPSMSMALEQYLQKK